jgi:hypothetical protein
MRTYQSPLRSGEISGFEVSNTWVQPRAAARLLTAKGAKVTFVRGLLRSGNVHLRFEYAGHMFELWEPFGDSSRYHVDLVEGTQAPPAIVQELRGHFEQYRPSLFGVLRSVFGG